MKTRDQHLLFWLFVLAMLAVGLSVFRDILLPFVAGISIAYFLNPVADTLQRRGMNRWLATSVIIGLTGVAVVTALILLVPLLVAQAKAIATSLPTDIERLRSSLEAEARARLGGHFPALEAALQRMLVDAQSGLAGSIGQIVPALLARSFALVNVISLVFITPLVAFYLLVDWHRMLDKVQSWLPRDHVATMTRLAADIDRSVAAFVRGQGIICLLLGVFYATALSLFGLRYGLVIGLATGLMAFVPVAGWMLGSLVALALTVAQFGFSFGPLTMVAAIMLAGMALDTAVLSPRLVGEKVGLHPVWLIFALFAFSYLFGFVGTLVAVPLAAATVVVVRHGMERYMQSDVYLGRTRVETEGRP